MSAPARDIVQARSYYGGRGHLLVHHPHPGPGHCPVAQEARGQRRQPQAPPDGPRRRLQAGALACGVRRASQIRQLTGSPPSRPGTRSLLPACCWGVAGVLFHRNCLSPEPSSSRPRLPKPTLHAAFRTPKPALYKRCRCRKSYPVFAGQISHSCSISPLTGARSWHGSCTLDRVTVLMRKKLRDNGDALEHLRTGHDVGYKILL